jgi:3D-(3,5/4)-trihydroxycyclohexane-1,2-dione acylhydrolase (decyclizing)
MVKFLCAQRTLLDGKELPLFGGVFAIFGHGNVTCLGEALEQVKDELPTWRGQNEQSMALAAVAYAKAKKRRQIMIATSSIGPGATNMVTAAGVAHSNRLPLLLISGDTFVSRRPDPVLQQVEHYGNPSLTVNDAFKAVTRYWDRITHPEQIISSLQQAVATLLDPADCGPVFIGLPQDVGGIACDYPVEFFEPTLHSLRRQTPDGGELDRAAELLKSAESPLLIAGGGVQYSLANRTLTEFAERHNIPVVETIAGRATLLNDHPLNVGPLGVTGSTAANALARAADVVLAIGTRLQDFTTGSWSLFQNPRLKLIALNAARFDASKHRALAVVGDAKAGLLGLDERLGDWRGPTAWAERAAGLRAERRAELDSNLKRNAEQPSYAQVIDTVNRHCEPDDYVLTAAGGLPAELAMNWRARSLGSVDIEFGFSCMGYEIAGGWGAKMAKPDNDVIVFVGDGSYMIMNSDIYSSVLSGHKMIVVVCDNGGFAVIDKLQRNTGNASFNNLIRDCRIEREVTVDFAKHAEAMGALAETVQSVAELEQAFARAKVADRTYVIALQVDPNAWTECDSYWQVGIPEISKRPAVLRVRAEHDEAQKEQRIGV